LVDDLATRGKLQELESKAEERRGSLRVAVCACDEVNVIDYAPYDIGFVDAETLILPEITVDYSLADGLFHYGCGVEAVGGKRAAGASLVEEALLICVVVCHDVFVVV
jgi:hypothetical protein